MIQPHPFKIDWQACRSPLWLSARIVVAVTVLVAAGQCVVCAAEGPAEKPKPADKPKDPPESKKDPFAWKSMFDGKTLKGWKVPQFGGDGEVGVKDGLLVMEMGSPMTGVTWTGELPKTNYEVELDAMRTEGNDFFATTTFPVGKESCSFVVGGWGGTIVGISCVDYYDAADNITTGFLAFKDDTWYHVRIRVTDARIECWIDDEQHVDLERKGHKFEIRPEVDLNLPFGISSYDSEGRLKNIRIRRLKPEEVEAAAEKK